MECVADAATRFFWRNVAARAAGEPPSALLPGTGSAPHAVWEIPAAAAPAPYAATIPAGLGE